VEHQLGGIVLALGRPDYSAVAPFAGLQAARLAVNPNGASATQGAELDHILWIQPRVGGDSARFSQEIRLLHTHLGVGS
jgi:hypothetical protein